MKVMKTTTVKIFTIMVILSLNFGFVHSGDWDYEFPIVKDEEEDQHCISPVIHTGIDYEFHIAYLKIPSNHPHYDFPTSEVWYSFQKEGDEEIHQEHITSGDVPDLNHSPDITLDMTDPTNEIPYVVWTGVEGYDSSSIYLARRNGENDWTVWSFSSEQPFNENPDIEINLNGDMWIVWEGWDGKPGGNNVKSVDMYYVKTTINNMNFSDIRVVDRTHYEEYDPPESDVEVTDYGYTSPTLALNVDGEPMIVWEVYLYYDYDEDEPFDDHGENFIVSRIWNENMWDNELFVAGSDDPRDTEANTYYFNPDIIFLDDEDNPSSAICVYEKKENYFENIKSKEYIDDNFSWENEVLIDDDLMVSVEPVLTLLDDTEVAVIWKNPEVRYGEGYTDSDIYASIYIHSYYDGPSWDFPEQISKKKLKYQTSHPVSLSGYIRYGEDRVNDIKKGYLYAVWYGFRQNLDVIYMNLYDNRGLQLVDNQPQKGETGVPVDMGIQLAFSEEVDLGSVEEEDEEGNRNIEVMGSLSGEIEWDYFYNSKYNLLIIIPTGIRDKFMFGERIDVEICGIRDIFGNELYNPDPDEDEDKNREIIWFETEQGEFLAEESTYAFPNPAYAGANTINFHVEVNQPGYVQIDIYNIAGKLIDSVAQNFPDQAIHNIQYDISGLASDVYIFVTTGEAVASGEEKKVIKKFAIVK